jgi:hypothetical protein
VTVKKETIFLVTKSANSGKIKLKIKRILTKGKIMDDPDDPMVTENEVPSYDVIAEKIKEIDNTIVIYRIYYLFSTFMYRFQLIKKDKMCMLEIPRSLLENLNKDGASSERELLQILDLNIENPDCWTDIRA